MIEGNEIVGYGDENRLYYRIDTDILLLVSSELCSIVNITTLPYEANYNYQKIRNVLLHAATSSTNTLESAKESLSTKSHRILKIHF